MASQSETKPIPYAEASRDYVCKTLANENAVVCRQGAMRWRLRLSMARDATGTTTAIRPQGGLNPVKIYLIHSLNAPGITYMRAKSRLQGTHFKD